MDHPFLTPFDQPPDDPNPPPVVPLTVAPPPPPRNSVGVIVTIGGLCMMVLAGLWLVFLPTDPPPTDSPVSVTTRRTETATTPTSPVSVFEEQDELDRRIERLIEAVAGGQPDVKVRLVQMRTVLGDIRFLRTCPIARGGPAWFAR